MKTKIIFSLLFVSLLVWAYSFAAETKKESSPGDSIIEKSPMIKVDYGTLSLGGVFQVWTQYQKLNNANLFDFNMQRAILLLDGTILTDKINYFMNVDFANFTDQANTPVLQGVELRFAHIPYTVVSVGKLLPYFTVFGPRLESNLVAIQYPVINQQRWLGRQVGIQTSTKIEGFDFYFGVFNGDVDSFTDQNNHKDYFVRAQYHLPFDFLTDNYIGGEFWHGFPYITNAAGNFVANGKLYRVSTFLYALWKDLTIVFEYLAAFDDQFNTTAGAGVTRSENQGGYLHIDYLFCQYFQGLLRVDLWDDNMNTNDNNQYWFTGGGNFFVYKNWATVGLNYVFHYDQAPAAGDSSRNHNILMQTQINF